MIFFFSLHYFTHFAGVPTPQEVNVDHDPIHEQDQRHAEQDG